MKVTDFPAPENGTHHTARKNGAQPKRPAAEPLPSPFAVIDAVPIDAPAWPLHSAAWFQPDLPPSGPAWTGLAVERHNPNPAPDFIHFDIAPFSLADRIDKPGDPRTPASCPQIPSSGLDPLGWDPRTVFPKEEPR